MSTIMFKCPCCGGYLEFDAQLQKFKCLYCGQVLSREDLEQESARREAEADARQEESVTESGEGSASEEGREGQHMRGYNCQMCGAQIVTGATTAATRCYYCHSPVVLHDRLDDDFRPDGVVPFALGREAAQARFMDYVRRKKFVDRRFFDEGQLEMFSGVYYPYWYFDVEGKAEFEGQGTRRSVATTSSYIITTTRYFAVRRKADLAFRDVARKALTELDAKLSDGIHPYDPAGVKPYASGYLSGFLAEMRDTDAEAVKDDVLLELNGYANSLIRSNHTFHSLQGETSFRAGEMKKRYILLPVWVLTWKGGRDGAPYYYLMNGQSGKVCGRLPVNKGKLWAFALGLGAVVAGLLTLGGMLLW